MYRALLCCLLVLLTACAGAPAQQSAGRGITATLAVATQGPTATVALTATTGIPRPGASAAPVVSTAANREEARVVRVVDGDTIDVQLANGQVERVRYIGVDTPE